MFVVLCGKMVDEDPARHVPLFEPIIKRVPTEMELDVGAKEYFLKAVNRWDGADVGEGTIVDHMRQVKDGDLAVEKTFNHGSREH